MVTVRIPLNEYYLIQGACVKMFCIFSWFLGALHYNRWRKKNAKLQAEAYALQFCDLIFPDKNIKLESRIQLQQNNPDFQC